MNNDSRSSGRLEADGKYRGKRSLDRNGIALTSINLRARSSEYIHTRSCPIVSRCHDVGILHFIMRHKGVTCAFEWNYHLQVTYM